MKRFILSAMTVLLAAATAPAAGSYGKMYWSDNQAGCIQRANLDGTHIQTIEANAGRPWGLAIDGLNGHLYWAEEDPYLLPVIQRCNLDGSNQVVLISEPWNSGAQFPQFMALDVAGGKIYYTSGNTRSIERANLDGTNPQRILTADLNGPVGIALDLRNNRIYWTHIRSTHSRICRSNLDGSGTVELLYQQGFFYDIELDLDDGYMYWADQHPNYMAIRRANLDGSNPVSIVTGIMPSGLALDLANGKVYWSTRGTPSIQRANLDGTGVETLISRANVPGLEYTMDVAIVHLPEPPTTTPTITGQPTNQTVAEGGTVTFFVTATGTPPLAYQWQKDQANLPDQTNSTLTLASVQLTDAGGYRVIVSNAAGSVTSAVASLTVLPRPTGPGSLDATFHPRAGLDGWVHGLSCIVPQLDGKLLIGGYFTNYDGAPRNGLARLNPDGSLDASFAPRLDTPSGYPAGIGAIALQADGKILIGGWFTTVNGVARKNFARLHPDGQLDEGFAPWFEDEGTVQTIAVQPDGRILIGGSFWRINGVERHYLARLHPDSSLDPSFVPAPLSIGDDWYITRLGLQSDGSIIVGGHIFDVPWESYLGVVRLHPDGSLDTEFRNHVKADYAVFHLLVLPDDKILVDSGVTAYGAHCSGPSRLHADGTLDTGFRPPLDLDWRWAMGVAPDGKVLVGGFNHLIQLNADGSLNSRFQTSISGAADNRVTCVAVQPDGQVLIEGDFTHVNGVPVPGFARLNGDLVGEAPRIVRQPLSQTVTAGSTATFSVGATGTAPLHFQWKHGQRLIAGAVTSTLRLPNVQSADAGDYRVVVSNLAGSVPSAAVRLTVLPTPTGSLDLSFDLTRGGELLGLESHRGSVQTVALQPDGKVIVGGEFIGVNGAPRYNLARLNADGTLDPSFNPSCSIDGTVLVAVVQPDGRVIIGGEFAFANAVPRRYLARLDADGTLDLSFDAGMSPFFEGGTYRMALQPDGKVVIGVFGRGGSGGDVSRLLRLNSDGSADSDFSTKAWTNVYLAGLALQPDGKLLVGLSTQGTNQPLLRLDSEGTPDGTFHPPFVPVRPNYSISVSHIALQNDGRMIIQGGFTLALPGGGQRQFYARLNADGSADPSFNAGANPPTGVETMCLQPDGKVLLGLWTAGLIRLNADGSWDFGFGAESPIPGQQPSVNALALRPDGRIVVGRTYDSHYLERLDCVYQLQANGRRDTNFMTLVHPAGAVVPALARYPNGQVLIGGRFNHLNGQPLNGMARLNADGRWDSSFRVALRPMDWVGAAVALPDGKALVSVTTENTNGNTIRYCVRLNPDGGVDSNLVVNVPFFSPVVVQPDGKILGVGGWDWDGGGWSRMSVVRLNPDGSLDPLFNQSGEGPDGSERSVGAVVLLPDGKILIGGEFESFNGVPRAGVARLHADGSLDLDFDLRQMSCAWVSAIALQSDGKLVLGGQGFYADGTAWLGTVIRVHPDGGRDPSFDTVWMDAVLPHSIVTQTDGRFIVAGNFYHGADSIRRHNIVRLNPDGSRDGSFDVGAGANGEVWSVLLQPDGQILISGYFSSFNGIPREGVARLNNDVVLSFVARQLPYEGGSTVRLVTQPAASVAVYAVQDQPPTGWLITNISHGGVFDRVSRKVKFGPFFDAERRALTYDALPPVWGVHGVLGVFSFTGEASADGVNSPISGDQYLTVAGLFPADLTPADHYLGVAEVTAYGAAWRRGDHWPVNPNPVAINYVTRAAALWRGGECYNVDRSITIEPLWWVNCRSGSVHVPKGGEPSFAKGCTATRHLLPGFVPAEPLTVTITVSPTAGVSAYAIEEQFPPGWAVANISQGGALDAMNGRVKWGPFLDETTRSLSYQTIPPADVQTAGTFSGLASYDGVGMPIAGDRQSWPSCRLAAEYQVQPGTLRLSLAGLLGARFQIEVSSDLLNWVPLMTVTNTLGTVQISDPTANRSPQLFYRARRIE